MRIKFLVTLLLLPMLFFAVTVHADEAAIDDLQEKIKEYEEKIDNLQGDAQTLSREIETANTQIYLTELKIENSIKNIAKTEKEVERLAGDIDSLAARITQLVDRITYQEDVLRERIRERYKSRETSPMMVLFGTSTLNSLVKKAAYLKVMEIQDNKVLSQMRDTKKTYNRQKSLFEDKKEEEEALQAQLLQEKANLDAYKADLQNRRSEKDRLLKLTQNDERKYQDLLAKARAELQSYSDYAASTGQGVIGANALGSGKDGWYYSQRDSRWAYDLIGNSSYNVFNSGCLVTSVAMVQKYYGKGVDPGDIADKDSYFFYGDMLVPWPGPGSRDYHMLGWGYPESAIDDALDNNNPVIVGVRANNSAGTHFVVLISGENGDYRMHDPIWGPDLKFRDYYSTSSIFEAVTFD